MTVHVPLVVLNQVSPAGFDWQVPGLREELVTAMIKALPKPLRRQLVPAPDTAHAVLARLESGDEPLAEALARELRDLRGVDVPADAVDWDRVPEHLRVTFVVEDERGKTLWEGKDLAALKARLAGSLRGEISRAAKAVERTGLRTWELDQLPRSFADGSVQGYPALVDAGESVDVKVFATEAEQANAMWEGTRRLVLLTVPSPKKALRRALTNQAKLELAHNPHTGGGPSERGAGRTSGVAGLLDDCIRCAADKLLGDAGGPAWDAAGFARLREAVAAGLEPTLVDTVERARRVLVAWSGAELALRGVPQAAFGPAIADAREQMDALVYEGFVSGAGYARLPDLERYLKGIERRLEKLPRVPGRDAVRMRTIADLTAAYRAAGSPVQVRWMLEELRVSFFAQTLGTAYPISEKRVRRALDEAR